MIENGLGPRLLMRRRGMCLVPVHRRESWPGKGEPVQTIVVNQVSGGITPEFVKSAVAASQEAGRPGKRRPGLFRRLPDPSVPVYLVFAEQLTIGAKKKRKPKRKRKPAASS